MNNSRRAHVNLVVALTMAGILTASYAGTQNRQRKLIKVKIEKSSDARTLTNMGLDVWEARKNRVVAAVTDQEITRIKQQGFFVQVISEDLDEYVNKQTAKSRLQKSSSPATYHGYDEIVAGLVELEDSGIAQTHIIGGSVEGRDIMAVKISDNPSKDEDEPEVLFLGCHHAREWISVEVPFYLAQYLVDNYASDPRVKRVVNDCEIWVVPVVNPDGYEYSRRTDRLWRKNRRNNGDGTYGVDLNRNYDYMWGGPGSSDETSSDTYRGPGPFSEPETQAVRDLILTHDFRALLSYHSYGQYVLYPWGHTNDWPPEVCAISPMAVRIAHLIRNIHGKTHVPEQSSDLNVISGDTKDFSYGVLGIPSFVIELRPEIHDPGFLLPEDQIMPVCEENLPAALYLLERIWWSDLNGDRSVDSADLAVFFSRWLETGCAVRDWCARTDLDHSGQVDFADFSVFSENWQFEMDPPGHVEFYEGFETQDSNSFYWRHEGDANWTATSDIAHEGSYSLRSGDISNNQSSVLYAFANIRGNCISFFLKVSTETEHDFLRFYIDGIQQGQWSGELDCWIERIYPTTVAWHSFKWVYEKDGMLNEGSDCAWIDDIRVYVGPDQAE